MHRDLDVIPCTNYLAGLTVCVARQNRLTRDGRIGDEIIV